MMVREASLVVTGQRYVDLSDPTFPIVTSLVEICGFDQLTIFQVILEVDLLMGTAKFTKN